MGRVTNLKVFAKRTLNFKTKCPRNAERSFFMNLFQRVFEQALIVFE